MTLKATEAEREALERVGAREPRPGWDSWGDEVRATGGGE
jgi:N6-adenosine-specific RNA methylase IME4